MKILHVISTLGRGGAERHLLDLLPALARRGIVSRVAYLKGDGALEPAFRGRGVPVERVRIAAPLDPAAALRLVPRAREAEIVHGHLFKGEVHAALAAAAAGRRLVVTRHADDAYLERAWVRPIARWTFGRAAARVAISESIAAYWRRRLGLDGAVEVVRYGLPVEGVPLAADEAARARAREALGLPPEAFVVGVVGRLVPLKGHRVLLCALERLPGVFAVFVGDGPERAALEAASARASGRVRFAGARDDVETLYPAFDVVAVPSMREGLGLVALEAMRAGVPVVASDVGGLREIVVDGSTGALVPAGDAGTLAAALDRLACDPDLRRSWGEAGRRRVVRDFSLDAVVERWASIYRRFAA